MKNQRLRLLVLSIALVAIVFGDVACSSSGSASREERSERPEFSAVQTGSYIPRARPKPQTAHAPVASEAKSKRQKRAAKKTESKPAATRPADDDYVPRGGFR